MGKRISVLVIDDDPSVLSVFRSLLESEGAHCETVHRGHEGLQKFNQHAFDIVFLDLVLPDLDGLDVLKILHRKYPTLHVVIISAQDDDSVIRECMKCGAKAYLVKPCPPEAILECVRDVARHRTADELRAEEMSAGSSPSPS